MTSTPAYSPPGPWVTVVRDDRPTARPTGSTTVPSAAAASSRWASDRIAPGDVVARSGGGDDPHAARTTVVASVASAAAVRLHRCSALTPPVRPLPRHRP